MSYSERLSYAGLKSMEKSRVRGDLIHVFKMLKSKDVIVRLYKALVRPRLEFCVQAWCPYLRKDIAMIKRIQKRATKLIEGLRDMSYSGRLSHTGLISMEKSRVRGDLIQVFKMLLSKDRVDFNKFFSNSVFK